VDVEQLREMCHVVPRYSMRNDEDTAQRIHYLSLTMIASNGT
jgi:hypothetical protein